MEIKRSGSRPSGKGPAEYFTGTVRIDPLFEAPEPARVRGAHVTFEPGARTAWHTHPLGQTLIVTSGLGWAQRGSGPIERDPDVAPGPHHRRLPARLISGELASIEPPFRWVGTEVLFSLF